MKKTLLALSAFAAFTTSAYANTPDTVTCETEVVAQALKSQADSASSGQLLTSSFEVVSVEDSPIADYDVTVNAKSRIDNSVTSTVFSITILDSSSCMVRLAAIHTNEK